VLLFGSDPKASKTCSDPLFRAFTASVLDFVVRLFECVVDVKSLGAKLPRALSTSLPKLFFRYRPHGMLPL